ncbi:MAG: hypothetical protein MHM6MM_007338 [Cercozoa sp. M6MM]
MCARAGYTVLAAHYAAEAPRVLLRADRIDVVRADVTSQNDLIDLKKHVQERYPQGIFAIINNAGVADGFLTVRTPVETWRRVFEVNCFGAMQVVRHLLPQLRERGRIVQVSSFLSRQPLFASGTYSASKAALDAASDALRLELAMQGYSTRVCVAHLGVMKTALQSHACAALSSHNTEKEWVTVLEQVSRVLGLLSRPARTHAETLVHRCLLSHRMPSRVTVGLDARLINALRWTLGEAFIRHVCRVVYPLPPRPLSVVFRAIRRILARLS